MKLEQFLNKIKRLFSFSFFLFVLLYRIFLNILFEILKWLIIALHVDFAATCSFLLYACFFIIIEINVSPQIAECATGNDSSQFPSKYQYNWYNWYSCYIVQEPHQEPEADLRPVDNFTNQNSPLLEQPLLEQPLLEQPLLEQPLLEQPLLEQPLLEQPLLEQPLLEQPLLEQPLLEQPLLEQPLLEQPLLEQPLLEQPLLEQPLLEQPLLEQENILIDGTFQEVNANVNNAEYYIDIGRKRIEGFYENIHAVLNSDNRQNLTFDAQNYEESKSERNPHISVEIGKNYPKNVYNVEKYIRELEESAGNVDSLNFKAEFEKYICESPEVEQFISLSQWSIDEISLKNDSSRLSLAYEYICEILTRAGYETFEIESPAQARSAGQFELSKFKKIAKTFEFIRANKSAPAKF